MYEAETFEKIMEQALNRVPSDVDKRQGSIIWDALAPACAELAQMYIEFDNILKLTYAETSFEEWLDKRCGEMGVYRNPATFAVRLGLMYGQGKAPFDIPVGSRFNIEEINYYAAERLEQGKYKLICETAGEVGNRLFGRLTPVETIRNLSYGEISEVLVPGEDEENDSAFYGRYVEKVNSTPFGGNIDDYKMKLKAIEGIGGCKIFPAWQKGGTVKATVINSQFRRPSEVFLEEIQEILDPVPFNQQGMGLAPIGHRVTVMGVSEIEIHIETTLTLKPGLLPEQFQTEVEEVIIQYLHELAAQWENQDNTIVRLNQLEARLLNISGVIDISDTKLNGASSNIILLEEEIPVMGKVVLYG